MNLDALIPALKAAGATVLGAATYLIAQVSLPDIGDVGNFGLVAVLAVLIGRYTFRQLEDYRADLKASRSRNDELVSRIEALEADLSKLGKAKAAVVARNRELEEYAHRLRVWAIAAGLDAGEIPPPPETPS
jgi:uncharacterized protein YigA (DUF484 family)